MARKKKPTGSLDLKELGSLPGKIRYLPYDCSCHGHGKHGNVYIPVLVESVDFDGCNITAMVSPAAKELGVDTGSFKTCVTDLYDRDRIERRRQYDALVKKIHEKLHSVVASPSYGGYSGRFRYSRDRKANFAAFMEDRNFVPEDEYEKLKEESNGFKSLGDRDMYSVAERFVVKSFTNGQYDSLQLLKQFYSDD